MSVDPISCELYDYIEIACTFRYPVTLKLSSGKIIEGIMQDTLINKDKSECVSFLMSDTEEVIDISLGELIEMQSLTENPHFEKVNFQSKQC